MHFPYQSSNKSNYIFSFLLFAVFIAECFSTIVLNGSVRQNASNVPLPFPFNPVNKTSSGAKSVSKNGSTGFPCQTSSDCAGPRGCYDWSEGVSCSSSSESCACLDPNNFVCTSSSDCLDNDRCYLLDGSSSGACLTCSLQSSDVTPVDDGAGNCGTGSPPTSQPTNPPTNPSGNNSPSAVCIAVESLTHFKPSELVFNNHFQASVLCDVHGNCATPNHMVVFMNRAMTMESYCEEESVKCVRRIKMVNSPKMKVGLRVKSKSKDLKFTALAARYGSKVEASILAAIVHMGV